MSRGTTSAASPPSSLTVARAKLSKVYRSDQRKRAADDNPRAIAAAQQLYELAKATSDGGYHPGGSLLVCMLGMIWRHVSSAAEHGHLGDSLLTVEEIAGALAGYIERQSAGVRKPPPGAIATARLLVALSIASTLPRKELDRVSAAAKRAVMSVQHRSDPAVRMKRKAAVESIRSAIAAIMKKHDLRDQLQIAHAAEEIASAFYWQNDLGIDRARVDDLAHRLREYFRAGALHHRSVDAEHIVSLCARHSGVNARLFTHAE